MTFYFFILLNCPWVLGHMLRVPFSSFVLCFLLKPQIPLFLSVFYNCWFHMLQMMVHNDMFQMAVIAECLNWLSQSTIFIHDNYGMNGICAPHQRTN